ncbi:response regulator transcription factor [Streptosporangium amethystogenes]|uniref:response regulator transcription factor n=1 Tax=Streptosporangium amethystogenes TaxID=2002 RepID=UPI0004CC4412|nr:LuxR C-terminal-related transcriptional regulator [Streptosporangium amethystogenes]
METLERVAQGGSVVDPSLVRELIKTHRRDDPLELLTAREQEVLALMAEGRSNAGIASKLWITEGTVEKHVHSILSRMRIPGSGDDHRRVLAVLAFLETRCPGPPPGERPGATWRPDAGPGTCEADESGPVGPMGPAWRRGWIRRETRGARPGSGGARIPFVAGFPENVADRRPGKG